LGRFDVDDRILICYKDGHYEITDADLGQRFEHNDIAIIEKYRPDVPVTAIYWDNDKKQYSVKRFHIETQTLRSKFLFIKEGNKNRLELVTTHKDPIVGVWVGKTKKDAVEVDVTVSEKVGV